MNTNVLQEASRVIVDREIDDMELFYASVYSQPGILLHDAYGNPNAPLGLLLESFKNSIRLRRVLREMIELASISPSASYVYTLYPMDGSISKLIVTTPLSHILVLNGPSDLDKADCVKELVHLGANLNDTPFCHHTTTTTTINNNKSLLYTVIDKFDSLPECLFALLDAGADFNAIWDPIVDLFFNFEITKLWHILNMLSQYYYSNARELPPMLRRSLRSRNPKNGQSLLHVLFNEDMFLTQDFYFEQVIKLLQSTHILLSMFSKDMNGITPLDLAREKAHHMIESNEIKIKIAEEMAKMEVERQQYNRAASDVLLSKNIPFELINRSDVD